MARRTYFEPHLATEIRDRSVHALNALVRGTRRRTISINCSFVTARQTTHLIEMPCAAKIVCVTGEVYGALGGTDAGTVTLNNAAGTAMTNGAISFPLSSAILVRRTAYPTANNTIAKGANLQVVAAKTTTNGEIRVQIEYEPTTVFGVIPENLERVAVLDDVSFVTADQTTHTLYFPTGARVTKVKSFVTTALAASDAGTITVKNNGGTAIAGGTLTHALSAAVADVQTTGSSFQATTFTAGQKIQFTAAKTTSGGVARVLVYYTVTDPATETFCLDDVRFTASEVGAFTFRLPTRGMISKLRGFATTVLAGSDDGTITLKNPQLDGTTSLTTGVVTFAASDAVATEPTAAEPVEYHWFQAGDRVTMTTAKSTAGGICRLQVEYRPDITPDIVVVGQAAQDYSLM